MSWSSPEAAHRWYIKHRERELEKQRQRKQLPDVKIKHRNRERLRLAKNHGFTSWEEYQAAKQKTQKTREQAEAKKQAEEQDAKQKKKTLIQFYKDKGHRPPWVIVDWTYEQYQQWLQGLGK